MDPWKRRVSLALRLLLIVNIYHVYADYVHDTDLETSEASSFFSCQGKILGDFYADVPQGCRIFHACVMNDAGATMDVPLGCAPGTLFDQASRQCQPEKNVRCSQEDDASSSAHQHMVDTNYVAQRRRRSNDEDDDVEEERETETVAPVEMKATKMPMKMMDMMEMVPKTHFTCRDKQMGSYYADLETDCKLFHICALGVGAEVLDFRFLCLNQTRFNPETKSCDTSFKCPNSKVMLEDLPLTTTMSSENLEETTSAKLTTTTTRTTTPELVEEEELEDELEDEEEVTTLPPPRKRTRIEDEVNRRSRGRSSSKNSAQNGNKRRTSKKELEDDEDQDGTEQHLIVVDPAFQILSEGVRTKRQVVMMPAAGTPGAPCFDYSTLPITTFTCVGKVPGSYYADPEAMCQMYHVCAPSLSIESLIDFRFLCPNGTVFDQGTLKCTTFGSVDCINAPLIYELAQPPIVPAESPELAAANIDVSSAEVLSGKAIAAADGVIPVDPAVPAELPELAIPNVEVAPAEVLSGQAIAAADGVIPVDPAVPAELPELAIPNVEVAPAEVLSGQAIAAADGVFPIDPAVPAELPELAAPNVDVAPAEVLSGQAIAAADGVLPVDPAVPYIANVEAINSEQESLGLVPAVGIPIEPEIPVLRETSEGVIPVSEVLVDMTSDNLDTKTSSETEEGTTTTTTPLPKAKQADSSDVTTTPTTSKPVVKNDVTIVETAPALPEELPPVPSLLDPLTVAAAEGIFSPESSLLPLDSKFVLPGIGLVPPGSGFAPPGSGLVLPNAGVAPINTVVVPPDSGIFPPDTIIFPPDTGIAPPNTGIVPPDTGIVPPDTGIVLPDTGIVPPDTGIIPPDTGIIFPGSSIILPESGPVLPDIGIVPPDTGIVPPDTGIMPLDTGIVPPDTGIVPPDTGIVPPDTGIVPLNTGIVLPDTGIIFPGSSIILPESGPVLPDIGIVPPDTGIVPPDTGIVPPDTGIVPPDTGIMPLDTGIVPPDTGIVPPDTGIVPPDTGIVPPDTGIVPPDTGIVPLNTGIVPPDTGIIFPGSSIVLPESGPVLPDSSFVPLDTSLIPDNFPPGIRNAVLPVSNPAQEIEAISNSQASAISVAIAGEAAVDAAFSGMPAGGLLPSGLSPMIVPGGDENVPVMPIPAAELTPISSPAVQSAIATTAANNPVGFGPVNSLMQPYMLPGTIASNMGVNFPTNQFGAGFMPFPYFDASVRPLAVSPSEKNTRPTSQSFVNPIFHPFMDSMMMPPPPLGGFNNEAMFIDSPLGFGFPQPPMPFSNAPPKKPQKKPIAKKPTIKKPQPVPQFSQAFYPPLVEVDPFMPHMFFQPGMGGGASILGEMPSQMDVFKPTVVANIKDSFIQPTIGMPVAAVTPIVPNNGPEVPVVTEGILQPVPAGSEFIELWITQLPIYVQGWRVRQKRAVDQDTDYEGVLDLDEVEDVEDHQSARQPAPLSLHHLPTTSFSCVGKVTGGYYADVETDCQLFHVCALGGQGEVYDFKFLCTNDTAFNQRSQTCAIQEKVDCGNAPLFYPREPESMANVPVPNAEIRRLKAPAASRHRSKRATVVDSDEDTTFPETSFNCKGKKAGGYYADPETDCHVFHVCARGVAGQIVDFRFKCANETVFNQRSNTCDEAKEVDCENSIFLYNSDDEFLSLARIPETDTEDDDEK